MSISRIDLADFGNLDEIAKAIFRLEPNIAIPVPVDALAIQLGIKKVHEEILEEFEGVLLTDDAKSSGMIVVNSGSSEQRRRFSIGHELGHFLSPWHKPTSPTGFHCSTEGMSAATAGSNKLAKMEVEANAFSAQLLMPTKHLSADLRRWKCLDLGHVTEVAKKYNVSKDAAARRYVSLQEEPCAIVVSQDGKLLRTYRHEEFPWIDISTGQKLPSSSISVRQDTDEVAISDWEEIDGADWLGTTIRKRQPMLCEQTLPQQNGYRLSLLTFLNDEAD